MQAIADSILHALRNGSGRLQCHQVPAVPSVVSTSAPALGLCSVFFSWRSTTYDKRPDLVANVQQDLRLLFELDQLGLLKRIRVGARPVGVLGLMPFLVQHVLCLFRARRARRSEFCGHSGCKQPLLVGFWATAPAQDKGFIFTLASGTSAQRSFSLSLSRRS